MPAVSALPEGLELEPAKMKVAGVNILPIVAKLFSLLPAKARRKAVSKQNAPSPDPAKLPRDLHDLAQVSPYTTAELIPGRMWEVTDLRYQQYFAKVFTCSLILTERV